MKTALSAQSLDLVRIAPALLLAGEHNALGAVRGQLAREVAAGRLIRLRRGLYAWRTAWDALDATERYQAMVLGVARTSGQLPVLSHASAAALHGLPVVGRWPQTVHQLIRPERGGRSTPDRIRHAADFDAADIVERDGLVLTGLARTLVDLARSASVFTAVASIDAAMHVPRFGGRAAITKAELDETFERMLPFRRSARARELLDFGDGRAESVSESNSRVTMARLGVPQPELQHRWVIAGEHYDSDFYWPHVDAIGESDGRGKYADPRLLGERTPSDVIYAEKLREDALRREARAFTRWDYTIGMSTSGLAARLSRIGVVPVNAPRLVRS
ncbi:hypothetical protein EV379_0448 [Microterricola gilva]|uniref:Uncharacterized protein n=1 Tax=Microterricola gilva TaxID=393267 RepID=A0A4Q8AIE4_9MICO|nr:hypothetical protein [Microterricola gilva]RZU64154.1 hypothetical protein EV379_0448 [Microterricola gilva]